MMNNMNNFGMSPFGMNPMLMNNFGMMGMNNQQNLMDENAIRIKNIIQPYENKIKELEEIIRQKDFEIALLKDKLNNNGINMQSQNIMNINQMNMMMLNSNQENKKFGKKIVVYCKNCENQIMPENYICNEYDITYKLLDKISPNSRWNLIKYTCDEKKLHPFLTLDENGIKDGSMIKVNFARNIIFRNTFSNSVISVAIDESYPFKKAIKFYLLRIGKTDLSDNFTYLYNGLNINPRDKNLIKDIFKLDASPNIRVIEN